ncbi:hypothetical protein NPIL_65171 [Nephila pilipes]|uniref:Uncharacterized protein n=1 Tax=Nephila pilipes TaxID=299642 RepID=A0A8X6J0S4_NEPPI|nr:hypothetical protein NPIL_65171 [Nephila pilipes]
MVRAQMVPPFIKLLRKNWWANMAEAAVENKEIDFPVDVDDSNSLLPPPEKETSCESVSAQYIPDSSRPLQCTLASMDGLSTDGRRHTCYERFRDACVSLGLYLESIRNNGYFSIVLLIFIAPPLSAVYMGMVNEYRCPVSEVLKTLVTILGILGCFIPILLIANLISRVRGNVSHKPYVMVIIGIMEQLAFLLLLFEAITFVKISPEFDNSSKNYCDKIFYDYVYYFNFVAFGILILMTVLYFPYSSFRRSSHCQIQYRNGNYTRHLSSSQYTVY